MPLEEVLGKQGGAPHKRRMTTQELIRASPFTPWDKSAQDRAPRGSMARQPLETLASEGKEREGNREGSDADGASKPSACVSAPRSLQQQETSVSLNTLRR